MTKEGDEFFIYHWNCLNKYRAKGEKLDGVLCLGERGAYLNNPASVRILISLADKGYLKIHPRPDPKEIRPVYSGDRCFEFTECGERLVKYLVKKL